MRLGTSLRFLFPTSPATHTQFQKTLAAVPPGTFIERPLGDYDTATQAHNLLEVAAATRAAGLDRLLFGDNHAVSPAYANSFAPIPSLARLMAETGDMPVGLVLLAPFYQPIVLAEQLGTLAAFDMPFKTRVGRLEENVSLLRRLLAGESVTHEGRYQRLRNVQISPLPPHPIALWIAGTVPASAERAGRIGDGWLTGQNADRAALAEQLDIYGEAAARAGRTPNAVLRRDIYCGASDAEADAAVNPILEFGYRGTGRDTLLVGGPQTIVQQLREYRAMGFEEVLVRHIVGDHALMLQSFARLGRDVLPAIRGL